MPVFQPNITERFIYTDFVNVMNIRDFTTLNIYVNSVTGQDSGQGRGSSPSSAYKSIKFAINDSFTLLNKSQVVIHLAGAAPHVLSPDQVTLDPAPTFGFNKRAPLVLRADPTLVATIPVLNVVSQANNVFSGLKEITTTGGLTPNAFNGKWLLNAAGVLARIFDNTAAVISTDYAGADLTPPFLIYGAGATITPEVPGSTNPTVVIRGSTDPVIFFGINVSASAGGAVEVGPGSQASFVACGIPSLVIGNGVNSNLLLPGAVECVACDMASLSLPAGNLNLSRCRFIGGTFTNMGAESNVAASQCSFESMNSPCFSDGASSPQEQSMTNCLVTGALASGVQAINGKLDMTTCDVAGSVSFGVFGLRQSTLKLTGVTSSVPNTGVGIYLQNGSVAEVDATTDLLSAGNAIQLGASGPTFATFAAFRVGASPFSSMAEGENSSVWQDAQGGGVSPGSGGMVVVTTTPYNVTPSDTYLLVDCTIGPITINLLPIASRQATLLTIKKIDATVNPVIMDGFAGEFIDGSPTRNLAIQYQSNTLLGGPTEWSVI
jgi:hypothetical protein